MIKYITRRVKCQELNYMGQRRAHAPTASMAGGRVQGWVRGPVVNVNQCFWSILFRYLQNVQPPHTAANVGVLIALGIIAQGAYLWGLCPICIDTIQFLYCNDTVVVQQPISCTTVFPLFRSLDKSFAYWIMMQSVEFLIEPCTRF